MDRKRVVEIAEKEGLSLPMDWRGVDAVLPLLERMRSEGSVVIIKFDGGRGEGDSGPYTALASGPALDGVYFRTDSHTLEDALAYIIVRYAQVMWDWHG